MNRPTLMQITNNPFSDGIFTDLAALSAPWAADIDGMILNMEYYGNHSGQKIVSPLVYQLSGQDGQLSAAYQRQLAQLAIAKYGQNWKRLYATLSVEYNPINNYDMTETEEEIGSNTGTVTQDNATTYGKKITHTGTQTNAEDITYGKTVKTDESIDRNEQTDYGKTETTEGNKTVESSSETTTTPNTTQDTTGQVYAFDSSSWENADHQTQTQTGTVNEITTGNNKDTTSGTVTDGGKDTTGITQTASKTDASSGTDNTSQTRTDNLSDAESGTDDFTGIRTDDLKSTINRTLNRSGNIGVTTTQQMLQAERELWRWNFMEIVYADLDKILTIDVYHI